MLGTAQQLERVGKVGARLRSAGRDPGAVGLVDPEIAMQRSPAAMAACTPARLSSTAIASSALTPSRRMASR